MSGYSGGLKPYASGAIEWIYPTIKSRQGASSCTFCKRVACQSRVSGMKTKGTWLGKGCLSAIMKKKQLIESS